MVIISANPICYENEKARQGKIFLCKNNKVNITSQNNITVTIIKGCMKKYTPVTTAIKFNSLRGQGRIEPP